MSGTGTVVSGIGRSEAGRHLGQDPLLLTATACISAINDAGLTTSDIDGLSTYPGAFWSTPGITGAGTADVREMLGLELNWWTGGGELNSQLGSVANAVMAIRAGLATHVLCFRTVWESTAQAEMGRAAAIAGGGAQPDLSGHREWTVPFGTGYLGEAGLWTQRYFSEFGANREQLAQIALTCRANAQLNPAAVYRSELTMADYLAAPMLSSPVCLYDCDVPVDGSIAVVVSAGAAASGVSIEAMGLAAGMTECGKRMWAATDLKPADLDVAQIYDGFSILALQWMEGLGICGKGEAASFVEGGQAISLGGRLPINTDGGQLSAGRLHGYGQLYEACVQLLGRGEERQVWPQPHVAAVTAGAATFTGTLLLTN